MSCTNVGKQPVQSHGRGGCRSWGGVTIYIYIYVYVYTHVYFHCRRVFIHLVIGPEAEGHSFSCQGSSSEVLSTQASLNVVAGRQCLRSGVFEQVKAVHWKALCPCI